MMNLVLNLNNSIRAYFDSLCLCRHSNEDVFVGIRKMSLVPLFLLCGCASADSGIVLELEEVIKIEIKPPTFKHYKAAEPPKMTAPVHAIGFRFNIRNKAERVVYWESDFENEVVNLVDRAETPVEYDSISMGRPYFGLDKGRGQDESRLSFNLKLLSPLPDGEYIAHIELPLYLVRNELITESVYLRRKTKREVYVSGQRCDADIYEHDEEFHAHVQCDAPLRNVKGISVYDDAENQLNLITTGTEEDIYASFDVSNNVPESIRIDIEMFKGPIEKKTFKLSVPFKAPLPDQYDKYRNWK